MLAPRSTNLARVSGSAFSQVLRAASRKDRALLVEKTPRTARCGAGSAAAQNVGASTSRLDELDFVQRTIESQLVARDAGLLGAPHGSMRARRPVHHIVVVYGSHIYTKIYSWQNLELSGSVHATTTGTCRPAICMHAAYNVGMHEEWRSEAGGADAGQPDAWSRREHPPEDEH